MTHGIRKVNEYLINNGRALIFTDNIDFSSDIDIWNSIANGSIYVNPEEGTLKYKKFNSQKGIWSMFKAPNILMENSITNNLILDYELDSEKFSTGAVTPVSIDLEDGYQWGQNYFFEDNYTDTDNRLCITDIIINYGYNTVVKKYQYVRRI